MTVLEMFNHLSRWANIALVRGKSDLAIRIWVVIDCVYDDLPWSRQEDSIRIASETLQSMDQKNPVVIEITRYLNETVWNRTANREPAPGEFSFR